MSDIDELELSEEESFEDFSNSEDDWVPPKKVVKKSGGRGRQVVAKQQSSDDSSSSSDASDDEHFDSADDFESDDGPEESFASVKKNKKKGKSTKIKNKSNGVATVKKPASLSLSMRRELYFKYKKRRNSEQAGKSTAAASISKTATTALLKKIQKKDEESSDSSGDDHLVNSNDIDLTSPFFQSSVPQKQTIVTQVHGPIEKVPDFDCNVGMNLSDSDDDEDEDNEMDTVEPINFDKNLNFNKKLEMAKEHFDNYQLNVIAVENESVDVTKLLAMGETSAAATAAKSKKRKLPPEPKDSDSDWEEVDDIGQKDSEIKDVEIRLQPNVRKELAKRQDEIEASIKRRINREKKERQILMHKVHVLCWIGHGNYVNQILNDPKLMEMCLKMIPSQHCYPKDRTDVKYFEQITKWYKTKIALKDHCVYPKLVKLPPLPMSLALQITTKAAICKRDYVFLFIILLRAIGIQCRLVYNFKTVPIRPPASELCVIKVNPEQPKCDPKNNSSNKKTDKSDASSSKTQKNHKKLPEGSKVKSPKTHKSDASSSKTQKNHKNIPEEPKLKSPKTEIPTIASRIKKVAERHKEQLIKSSPSKSEKNVDMKLEVGKSTTIESTKAPSKKKLKLEPKDVAPVTIASKIKKVAELNRSPTIINSPKNPTQTATSIASKIKTKSQPEIPAKSPIKTRSLRNRVFEPVPQTKAVKSLKQKLDSNKAAAASTQSSPISKHLRTSKRPHNPPQLDGANDDSDSDRKKRIKNPPVWLKKAIDSSTKRKKDVASSEEDSDFAPSKPKVVAKKSKPKSSTDATKKPLDSRLLSTDDEQNGLEEDGGRSKKSCVNIWVEVYCEDEEKWISIDIFKSKVHCVEDIRRMASKPMAYILAWNNNNSIKDVSPRYCPQWNTVTRKLRADQDWFCETIHKYKDRSNARRNNAEDKELNKIHLKEPLPTVISEYKNHPLYALKRHLLKFEAIYPPDCLTMGFVRGEPVYARECVHTLHSREIWVKQARTVKLGESAYKIVKARPKWDRLTNKMLEPLPLEIFGMWQTKPYEPPTAENGIVPRNAYGNVELFKPEMLPKKTVHLQLPGLNRTCNKMKIDCAQAVVGFDFHSGSSHPTFDGFVVCEEFADQVIEQWWKDQQEAERKAEAKREERVLGNWKKLIRGLLIRERLQRKYNFKDDSHSVKHTKKSASAAVSTGGKKK